MLVYQLNNLPIEKQQCYGIVMYVFLKKPYSSKFGGYEQAWTGLCQYSKWAIASTVGLFRERETLQNLYMKCMLTVSEFKNLHRRFGHSSTEKL